MHKEPLFENSFPELSYTASEISRYLYSPSMGMFTLSIKDSNETIHFTPENAHEFVQWLKYHNIIDILGK